MSVAICLGCVKVDGALMCLDRTFVIVILVTNSTKRQKHVKVK